MADEYKQNRDTELILPPGTYAYVLDETKGKIVTHTGPTKTSISNTDRLVVYNQETKRFDEVAKFKAIQTNIVVPKGYYVILENPPKDGKQPELGKPEDANSNLKMGQIENKPGPLSFPLWPSQTANVVLGHHLRSNHYLLVRVYDDEAAQANWDKGVVKVAPPEPVHPPVAPTDEKPSTELTPAPTSKPPIDKASLVTGQLLVIKGTEVSFYIPASGLEVLPDEDGKYIRDAVTLERLEYSILLNEDGNKEYVKGPAVVFPLPTQQFVTSKTDGNKRKFRAFELQDTSGIHVKVIADYTDADGSHLAGEELFITGAKQAIYYPRPEHAIISYGSNEKYNAIAIPDGEARYVLDRKTGAIDTIHGHAMFLANPIHQVLLRRILSDTECRLYYPGNDEVLAINQQLREQSGQDYSFGNTNAPAAGAAYNTINYEALETESIGGLRSRSLMSRESSAKGLVADTMNRGTKFTPQRTIVLNTKYDGAVHIEIFAGYAVQVVNSKGKRRTVVGPDTLNLEYDEKLVRLSFSKGTPKSSDNRLDTVYLKYISNPISDILLLKTQDLVNTEVRVKYLVRFDENQKDKWFSIDNYIQYMVDHLRSLIGNTTRNKGVQEFYQNATDILRDTVLGVKNENGERPLHHFEENGMTVYDLELIYVKITDTAVAQLLADSRQEVLRDSIQLEQQKQKLILTQGQEAANRAIKQEIATSKKVEDQLVYEDAERTRAEERIKLTTANEFAVTRKKGEQDAAKIEIATKALYLSHEQAVIEMKSEAANDELERKVKLLAEEAASSKTRMEAVQPALVEALLGAANAGILERVTPHLAALAFVNGQDLEQVLGTVLKGTGAEGILSNLKSLTAQSRSRV